MLDSLDYEFDAVLVQVAADTSDRIGQLLREIRQRKPPVKSILQIIGKNEDEVHSAWLKDATLTLPSDLQESEFQRQIDELFDPNTSR